MDTSIITAPKTTAKLEIIKRLSGSDKPLAVHEFGLFGYSENNIATRLSELAKEGAVIGKTRPGKAFKEWALCLKLELL